MPAGVCRDSLNARSSLSLLWGVIMQRVVDNTAWPSIVCPPGGMVEEGGFDQDSASAPAFPEEIIAAARQYAAGCHIKIRRSADQFRLVGTTEEMPWVEASGESEIRCRRGVLRAVINEAARRLSQGQDLPGPPK